MDLKKGGEVKVSKGLVHGHAYSILRLEEVKLKSGRIQKIVKLRNPWSKLEWDGDWSDGSDEWDNVSKKLKI